ncbi:MAG: aminodeoxychorismate synthase component I [Acidobacteriaceae bacterium]
MNVSPGSLRAWIPLPQAWRAHAISTPNSVLLETAGGLGDDHLSYLFTSPVTVLRAGSPSELLKLLEDIEDGTREGLYAAGQIDYEAAYALHDIRATLSRESVACFGIYRQPSVFDHRTGIATGPVLSNASTHSKLFARAAISHPQLQMTHEVYAEKFVAVQRFLAAGDTYQVNLTTRAEAEMLSSPLDLYECLIESQPVDFAAILHFGDSLTLSFSHELFFRLAARRIVARPMKGTAPRGLDAEDDARQREWLTRDEKNHAEHVMIVDLLRNDLGRICAPGSVCADDLFRVEPYPTLFQMTSKVSGELRPEIGFADVMHALFPSGSVTGAPKRRTIEIIRDLEDGPRGVYTGAIGFVSPTCDACFSVPIRTLSVRDGYVVMGVGGGIVADSTATSEYDECVLKTSFLEAAAMPPKLIETLLWNEGYPLIDLHIARLKSSAARLGFRCDTAEIRRALANSASEFKEDNRIRLLLSIDGGLEIDSAAIVGPRADLRVRVAARRIRSTDPFRQHKSTRRTTYDRELARARSEGFDEVLFLNERGELAEGAISNLFVEIDGRLSTPPLSSGALPGVYRQHLLNTRQDIVERVLRLDHLESASAVFLVNAVRGLRSVGTFQVE